MFNRYRLGDLSRRAFLATGLALAGPGCRRGRTRRWTGGIVGASHRVGHRLRDEKSSAPIRTETADVIVVGGGMSGLIAAHRLRQAGRSVILLELESQVGGNAVSGRTPVSAHPWGAHYVPVPSADMTDVCDLFAELGLGRPGAWNEEPLCHDPHERLWIRGRWQEGLIPTYGVGREDQAQIAQFFARIAAARNQRGADGRRAFCLPVDRCSRDVEFTALDGLTMDAWMTREGFTSDALRWYVDYSCRDDYGAGSATVSAWAGLHYFAARDSSEVFTWPEGNGWIVSRLREKLAGAIRPGHLVTRVTPGGEVTALDVARDTSVRWQAAAVICAAPRFIAQHIVEGLPPVTGLDYSPWMVANLSLRRPVSAVWDNVLRESRSLGYVVATHQSLSPVPDATVITYYLPLDHLPPAEARRQALARSYDEWGDAILDDLRGPHPRLADDLTHLDVWLWGHGMARPTPGVMFGGVRTQMQQAHGRVVFAHTDLSGLSIFEEACHWGNHAAHQILHPA